MVCIEVSLGFVELATLANIDHRLSKALGVSGLPIGARIVMREVG
jgi:hypothetical protein